MNLRYYSVFTDLHLPMQSGQNNEILQEKKHVGRNFITWLCFDMRMFFDRAMDEKLQIVNEPINTQNF